MIANLEGHENEVKCVAWSSDGAYLASCSRDKSVWIWDLSDEGEYECCSVLTIHSQDVKNVTWHPTRNLLVSSSYDNTVKISRQDDDDWMGCATLNSHDSTVWASNFNEQGTKLVSCSDDKTLKFWKPTGDDTSDDSKWVNYCTVSGYHQRTIYSVKWSKEAGTLDLIATGSADNSIHIFKEQQQREGAEQDSSKVRLLHHEVDAHDQDVNCVDWHPTTSGMLASCSDDSTIKLWRFTPNPDDAF